MKFLVYSCLLLLPLFLGCSNVVLLTEAHILEELQAEADRDGKSLSVDTLKILSQIPITTFVVIEEELNFYREYKSQLTELNNLQLELKASLLEDLNEINHKYPTVESQPRLDYLNQSMQSCDSALQVIKPELDKATRTVNEILSQTYNENDDQLGYYETTYYISGKVNSKVLNDTVKVYNRNGLEYFVSLTNVLYVEE